MKIAFTLKGNALFTDTCKLQAYPDIMIDQADNCDVVASLSPVVHDKENRTIKTNFLSATCDPETKQSHHEKRKDANQDQDLFSTNYKKDSEECSIHVAFYNKVRV